jgi:hypothetical protein
MLRTQRVLNWIAISLAVGSPQMPAWGQDAPAAQESRGLAGSSLKCSCSGDDRSSTVAKIKATLAEPLKPHGFDFADTPLEQFASALQDEYGIPIQLDLATFHDAGLNPDAPITAKLNGVSLKSALCLALKQQHLTYLIEDEVLLITTPEDADTHLATCVYDVRDLLTGKDDSAELAALADTVKSCVAPQTWSENGGGDAVIRPLKPGLLAITQSEPAQEQIHELLDAIRRVRQ